VSDPAASPLITEDIPPALAGQRVDRIVALITGCSRAEASALIAAEQVLVDGAVVTKASLKLDEGQQVALLSEPVHPVEVVEADPDVEVRVVFSDDDIIVIDKPAGLVVHPGPGHSGSTLVHGLLARFPELADVGEPLRPGLVHRLDRGTSGLLVVARTPEAYTELVHQLSSHTVARVYTAMVWRHLEHRQGVVDAPIGRSRRDPLRMTVALDGRESRTHYRVDAEFDQPVATSLLTCELETGRTHQIRVHLASIGHAVLGDDLYGGIRHSFPMPRPFLHARELAFLHPATGDEVRFSSPLPDELQQVLDRFS
jgi:23S rRNA pseudouridine1911/1915/1917 synthase